MNYYFSKRISSLQPSAIREILKATQDPSIIPFAAGNPDASSFPVDAIKKIADQGPCVLVGRCADYALEGYDNVINIFIYADMNARIRKVKEDHEKNFHEVLTDAKAKDMIIKEDKRRASYYNYYTNKEWGDAKGYDLCINSAKLGIDGTVEAIKEYVKIRNEFKGAKL